ncbi:unnamed protein product [Leptidea sinapis]|uniref:40S ribosomal protein S25 n=1 Tax=Leptidea sinapis TaxID=189913 RepID=A0A5E4Q051_9NEOP|nr:unnamed protein product [Leptidea sinapis]
MPPKKDTKTSAKQPQKTQKKKEGSGGGKAKKKYKLITPAVVSERLKVRGSLARRALIELRDKGLIKQVVQHHGQVIYTRATKGDDPVA